MHRIIRLNVSERSFNSLFSYTRRTGLQGILSIFADYKAHCQFLKTLKDFKCACSPKNKVVSKPQKLWCRKRAQCWCSLVLSKHVSGQPFVVFAQEFFHSTAGQTDKFRLRSLRYANTANWLNDRKASSQSNKLMLCCFPHFNLMSTRICKFGRFPEKLVDEHLDDLKIWHNWRFRGGSIGRWSVGPQFHVRAGCVKSCRRLIFFELKRRQLFCLKSARA